LMEVVILRKLRPAALEVLLIGAIVPNLHFIGSSSPGVCNNPNFSKIEINGI
jgi:hypothetical protein